MLVRPCRASTTAISSRERARTHARGGQRARGGGGGHVRCLLSVLVRVLEPHAERGPHARGEPSAPGGGDGGRARARGWCLFGQPQSALKQTLALKQLTLTRTLTRELFM